MRGVLLRILGWTALAAYVATDNLVRGRSGAWGDLFVKEAIVWLSWGLLAPAIGVVSRRYPIVDRSWPRNVVVHLGAGLVAASLSVLSVAFFHDHLLHPPAGITFGDLVAIVLPRSLVIAFSVYCIIAAIQHGIHYYRSWRTRELAASQLEARLAEARLDVLRMQMQPHFLFNTLHTISGLMATDVVAARRMIARLSDLLRLSLDDDAAQEVTLADELRFLELYAEIQRMRFHDRLTIDVAVDDDARHLRVPPLVLQPLVENAIRHGTSRHARHGLVRVRGVIAERRLVLTVEDNGGGLRGAPVEGVGLGNTRARLEQLYGDDASLVIENRGDGVVVTIVLPALAATASEDRPTVDTMEAA